MIKRINFILRDCFVVCIAGLLFGCNTERKDDKLILHFEGREIDVKPYFKDFPFSRYSVSRDGSKLIFFKTGDSTLLQFLNIEEGTDIRNAKNIIDMDFAQRNCWSPEYNSVDGNVYWIGDENNDEIINIYRTIPESNQLEKLTDVPYIYAWNFNENGTKIAYVARMGQNENRLDELHVLDLISLRDTLMLADNSDFRFTWGSISWQPEDKGVVLLALKDADRTYTNVVYVDFESGKMDILTDFSKEASLSGCKVLDNWYDPDVCYFLSDQDGYSNLYQYNLSDKKVKQISKGRIDIDDAGMVIIDGTKHIVMYQKSPVKTTVSLLNPSDNRLVWSEDSYLNLQLGSCTGNQIKNLATATDEVFQLLGMTVDLNGASSKILLDVPPDIRKSLIHANVERVEIPTFDIDSATGQKRLLHAYLFKPFNPLPANKQLVMIQSFYGGENTYNEEYQIFAQAGIYVLSPSPRGSSGFGRDFAAMNDKDLGGNEILDIIYTAKYISAKLNIPSKRVGVFGMSHGGYATMRLLTFPGQVNGYKADFPFGFGIETAGFSDIIFQHRTSNIPDWTLLEAGDPAIDSLKISDRSPINHAEKLSGPLLLIHGSNDNRVNVEGSRKMAAALDKLNKPYTYEEFPGLGHGIKGIENSRKYYAVCFDFLEKKVLK